MSNDRKKIKRLVAQGKIPPLGMIHLGVAHDDWCRTLTSFGECDCDPNITVGLPPREEILFSEFTSKGDFK